MAKLILHRAERAILKQAYKVYLNRIRIGEVRANKPAEFELEPGRYQLNVGSFFAQEAEIWIEMGKKDLEVQIHSDMQLSLNKLPKYLCLSLSQKEA